jgi:predicted nucleic acid-binding protein
MCGCPLRRRRDRRSTAALTAAGLAAGVCWSRSLAEGRLVRTLRQAHRLHLGPDLRRARKRGRPIADDDTWTAASCIAHDVPPATANVRHCADFAEHHRLVLATRLTTERRPGHRTNNRSGSLGFAVRGGRRGADPTDQPPRRRRQHLDPVAPNSAAEDGRRGRLGRRSRHIPVLSPARSRSSPGARQGESVRASGAVASAWGVRPAVGTSGSSGREDVMYRRSVDAVNRWRRRNIPASRSIGAST